MSLDTALNLISTLAVVGAVVFAGWQLKLAARERTTQASLQLLQSLRSQEFVDGLLALLKIPSGLSRAEFESRLGPQYGQAMLVMMTLDGLGLMVYRGEIDARLANDFFKHSIAVVWDKMKATIMDYRKELNSEMAVEWLQWLAEKFAKEREAERLPAYRRAG